MSPQVRRQTTVNAQNTTINDSSNSQQIEDLRAIFPRVCVAVFFFQTARNQHQKEVDFKTSFNFDAHSYLYNIIAINH
jgi:hypothetical protein